jgi:hypothetical protein
LGQASAGDQVVGHLDHPPPSRPSGSAEALKRGGRIDTFLAHQDAFGLLDQHPLVQRRLQLRRQPPFTCATTAAASRLATIPA